MSIRMRVLVVTLLILLVSFSNFSALASPNLQAQPEVLGAAWSPDDSQILSWAADGNVTVWDATKKERINVNVKVHTGRSP